jgi:hypothetical protein
MFQLLRKAQHFMILEIVTSIIIIVIIIIFLKLGTLFFYTINI